MEDIQLDWVNMIMVRIHTAEMENYRLGQALVTLDEQNKMMRQALGEKLQTGAIYIEKYWRFVVMEENVLKIQCQKDGVWEERLSIHR